MTRRRPAPLTERVTWMASCRLEVASSTCVGRARRCAARRTEGGAYLLVLAAVIWHEMAHAEGVDETGARQREEDLWESFVRAGRVESGVGLSYLAELRQRR